MSMQKRQKFSAVWCFLATAVLGYVAAIIGLVFFDLYLALDSAWLLVFSAVLVLAFGALLRHLSLLIKVHQTPASYWAAEPEASRITALNRAILGASFSARMVMDGDGVIVCCNDALCELTGHTERALIGTDMVDLLVPERDRESHRSRMVGLLRSDDGCGVVENRTEIDLRLRDCSEIPIQLTVNAVRQLTQSYFVAEVVDLREHRAVERELRLAKEAAEAADRAKTRLLATISHEIRTPLNAVLGIVSLMRSHLSDNERENLLDTAEKSGDLLLGVLNGVLDYSRIETGEMTLNNIPFSLVDRVNDAVELFHSLAQEKGLEILAVCDPLCSGYVLGDAAKLSQILNNLISNAIKFTDSGVVRVELKRVGFASGGTEYRLSVSDTGIGIETDRLVAIFDAFSHTNESYTQQHMGAGLGLAISRQLVTLMGGDISVSSRLGSGSVFTLKLALAATEAPPIAPIRRHQAEAKAGILPILLVEDSAANQMVIRIALRRAGYAVTVVSDGLEARDQLRDHGPFSLVLSDVRMPRMDGLELARWMRQTGISVPIIALTAKASAKDEAECLAAGMSSLLVKPFDFSLLESTVAKWINQTPAQEATESGLVRALRQNFPTDEEFAGALEVAEKELRDLLSRLQEAAVRHDSSELGRVLHRLKGLAAGYQLRPIHDACEDLEELSGVPQQDHIGVLAGNISLVLDEIAALPCSGC